MGKPERKIRERLGSSPSYLLRCFGISRKIHSDKPNVEIGLEKKKKKKTTTHWFLRSRFKNDEITPATKKQKSNVEDDKQKLFRVIHHETDQKNVAPDSYKTVEQDTKQKYIDEQRDMNPDPLSFLGYDMCHEKEERTTVQHDQTKSKTKSPRVRKGSFDPLIGILIIMVTLVIMLIWGRLCAIICTSTWCYFLPRLKQVAAAKCKGSGGGEAEDGGFDLNSEAYKKKVVLEGFLLRQRRVSL